MRAPELIETHRLTLRRPLARDAVDNSEKISRPFGQYADGIFFGINTTRRAGHLELRVAPLKQAFSVLRAAQLRL